MIESSTNYPTVETINNLNVGAVVVVGIITHQYLKDICEALKDGGYKVILVKDATSVLQSQDVSLIESTCNELEQAGTVELILRNEILFYICC